MAKFTKSSKLKGELNFEVERVTLYNQDGDAVDVVAIIESTITETVKIKGTQDTEDLVYNLVDILGEYTGEVVGFNMSVDEEIQPSEDY